MQSCRKADKTTGKARSCSVTKPEGLVPREDELKIKYLPEKPKLALRIMESEEEK